MCKIYSPRNSFFINFSRLRFRKGKTCSYFTKISFFIVKIYAQLNIHLPPNYHRLKQSSDSWKYIGSKRKCYNIISQMKVKSKKKQRQEKK